MEALEQYLKLARENADSIRRNAPEVMNLRRDDALSALEQRGLPTRKVERYKYTSVKEAFAPNYGLDIDRRICVPDPARVFGCNALGAGLITVYVVNDRPFTDGLSLPEGLEITTLAAFAAANPGEAQKYYHQAAAKDYDGVTEVNTLLATDALVIRVRAGFRIDKPVQVVNIAVAPVDVMANRRVLVIMEERSEATLLFCDHSNGPGRSLTTQVAETYVGESACLRLYNLEETGTLSTRFSNLYSEQQAGSHVAYGSVTLTCGLTRNMADFHLLGEGATVVADGAVVADGKQRIDNNLLVDHAVGGCTSDLLYKYVLDGQSVGAFAGRVLVRPGAQHTSSQQTNSNLCASQGARAYTQPMLEIYADDVKCNHGSTVGMLDEAALFYMRQRGILEEEAKILLQHAFINDVLQRIEIETLRERLSHLVEMRFRGQLAFCRECRLK